MFGHQKYGWRGFFVLLIGVQMHPTDLQARFIRFLSNKQVLTQQDRAPSIQSEKDKRDKALMHIHISIPGIQVEDKRSGHQAFVSIDVVGEGHTIEAGSPRIPVIQRLIAVDAPEGVSVVNVAAKYELHDLPDMQIYYPIEPYQGARLKRKVAAPFKIDRAVYTKHTYLSNNPVRLSQIFSIKGKKYVSIRRTPSIFF